MRFTFLLFFFVIFCSCADSKDIKKTESNKTKNANNVVIVNSKNAVYVGSSNDKVVFKGENNLVEINNESSTFKSKNSNNVFIVEGNQNMIHLNQAGITDSSENSNDRTIIRGDRMRKEFNSKAIFDYKSTQNESEIDTVLNSSYSDQFNPDNDEEPIFFAVDELMMLTELDSMVTIGEAIEFYNSEILKGNMDAYYKLGTFYQFGVGVKRNILKAIEYFEIAARNNHLTAQLTLGTIYKEGFRNILPNAEKANYYFKLAEKNNE